MKALTFHGKRDVRVDEVPDPSIQDPTDAIVRITSTAICGSDLHLYEVLGMFIDEGDILGHEPIGIIEEVGPTRCRCSSSSTRACRSAWARPMCGVGPTRSCRCWKATMTRSASTTSPPTKLPLSEAPNAYEMFQKKEDGGDQGRP